MFRQLRDLFRRTEPRKEGLRLSFEDLPGWLDDRGEDIQSSLSSETAPSMEAIRGALDRLGGVIDRMEEAEEAEKVHPRLRDISKKALPQFTKSMTQILSREPSGDPEAFYATAADILKSALKTVKGQGKYLSSLYPGEMKEVRAALKDLGREINAMTGAVARARGELQQVEDLREMHESLNRIREEHAAASVQARGHSKALEEMDGDIQKTAKDLTALRLRPDHAHGEEIQERIRELDVRDEEVRRQAASIRTTAIHVFRKAERVATRAGETATAAGFDQVLDAYTPDGDADTLIGLIESMMPATLALIRQGDLALKNQEEIALFSDPDTLPSSIRETLYQRREIEEQCAALREAHAALPVVIEEERLIARLSGLEKEREAKAAMLDRAYNQQEILASSYAEERERLRPGVGALAGEDVEVSVPDLAPP
ncbi:MAG: hypothetical protein GX882_08050 [Methanomicrobiales archaeon]|nr:hypothetical protein [Methanomicrobiales archaeon]